MLSQLRATPGFCAHIQGLIQSLLVPFRMVTEFYRDLSSSYFVFASLNVHGSWLVKWSCICRVFARMRAIPWFP